MANVPYYDRFFNLKKDFVRNVEADQFLQVLASKSIGLKPQCTAVNTVARVYCTYCQLYNKLCECYDQMTQVQRREYLKKVIDAVTCRILETKRSLENIEAFEYTYYDNALIQMLMIPDDVQVLCPFFYPFEIRQKEMQYIVDQITSGNRIGDPTPTPSQIDLREQDRLQEERIKQEEKDAEIRKKLALGEDIEASEEGIPLTAKELEELRIQEEYNKHLFCIQRMERARVVTRSYVRKANKGANIYLEFAGLKTRLPRNELVEKAAKLIQLMYRRYMELKRENLKELKRKERLDMVMPSWQPPSAKIQQEKVKTLRRSYREKYYEKWIKDIVKENAKVLKLRENYIIEDITTEIRQWFRDWYDEVRIFDEYPWATEGGSILVVSGQTFTIEEYMEWRTAEEKRLKAAEGNLKSKEQIKQEKLAAKMEKKEAEIEAQKKEAKKLADYKKTRLKPENDPGVYVTVGKTLEPILKAWADYENHWRLLDRRYPHMDVIRGFLQAIITENAYQDVLQQMRPIVDEMMKLELKILKQALFADYKAAGVTKLPLIQKRKKPRIPKPPKPFKTQTEFMFQNLFDNGIIREYPKLTLDDYWGDRNYASAETRAIQWTPWFPPPCLGDALEQVRIKCLLMIGADCPNAERVQLIVGPNKSGKKTLIYAIASETNAVLFDLSPKNIFDKYPGKKIKTMYTYINKVSRLMQPSIIFIDEVDKIFYKKVPKEEKYFEPGRIQKEVFKEIIKPIKFNDKILVLGTATEPWLSKAGPMSKAFPNVIMLPRSDFGSNSIILNKLLMKYHGVHREVDIPSLAQVVRGFDANSLIKSVGQCLNGERVAQLAFKPLEPMEILKVMLNNKDGFSFMDYFTRDMYSNWYLSYSKLWGPAFNDYIEMLDSQLQAKLKAEKGM